METAVGIISCREIQESVPGFGEWRLIVEVKYVRICRVRCNSCGQILEWKAHSRTDCAPGMIVCNCRKIGLCPAASLYRIAALDLDAAWEDLSIPWDEYEDRIPNAVTIAALEEVERM